MDLSCPDGSHPFSQPLLSSADAGWELPFHQISCSSLRQDLSVTLDPKSQWNNQQGCLDFHCTVMSWYSASFTRTEEVLLLVFWKQEGKPSSLLFVSFCAIPLTCGCFYGGSTARMELNCQTWDRLPMPIIEVLQAAGVPGLHLPLWNGDCVTGPPWMFMSQRLLRCMAWLCCCTLNCSPDLLWVLASLSS